MEEKFIKHLVDILAGLTFAYENFLSAYKNVEKMTASTKASEEPFYDLAFKRLRDEIDNFQKYLKECFQHYAIIKQSGRDISFFRGDLQKEIDKIIDVRKRIDKTVPIDVLKKRLSPEEFRFHQYIDGLTPEKLETFYEINYNMLYQEKDKKKKK